MRWFRNLSIRWKLVVMMTLTSLIGLVVLSFALFTIGAGRYRAWAVTESSSLARIVGAHCAEAVLARDADTARRELDTVAAGTTVERACLYSSDGQLLAQYTRAGLPARPAPAMRSRGETFIDGYLELFRPIELNRQPVGVAYLRVNLEHRRGRFETYVIAGTAVAVVSWLISLVLATRLQRIISRPIQELVRVARAVMEKGDYSLRATKVSEDESGLLTDAFNQILAQAQKRASDSQVQREFLEKRVVERTRDLQKANDEMRLLQSILLAIGETDDVPSAMRAVLSRVCEATGWQIGQAWLLREDGQSLECCAAWHTTVSVTPELRAFRRLSEETVSELGSGASGRAWEAKKPFWIADVSKHDSFVRGPVAQQAGIRAGVWVPVLAAGHVVALLEFLMLQSGEPDVRLVEVVSAAAGRIGSLVLRKRAENALRLSEERFRLITRATTDGVWDWDLVSNRVWRSESYAALFLYRPEEVGTDSKWFMERVHPEDRERILSEFMAARNGGADFHANEYRFRRADGQYAYVCDRTHFLRNERGEAVRAVGGMIDITGRRQAEDILRESEEKYRRLHESMSDAFARVDMNGRIQECNRAFREMLGYAEKELRSLTYMELTPSKWHAAGAKIVQEQVIARGYSDIYEKEYRRKDGTVFPVELRTFLLRDNQGRPVGMWAIVRDITARKQAEEALRRSEEVHRGSIEAAGAVPYTYDPRACRYEFMGAGIEALTGYTPRECTPEMFGSLIEEIVMADGRTFRTMSQAIREFSEGGGTVWLADYRIRARDGSERWLTDASVNERDADGQVFRSVGLLFDITARKRAEQELEQKEKLLRNLGNNIPDGCVYRLLVAPDGRTRFEYVSAGFEHMFELQPDAVAQDATLLYDLLHPDDRDAALEAQKHSAEDLLPFRHECRFLLPGGRPRWVRWHSMPERTAAGGTAWSGVAIDITARKQMEEQIAKTSLLKRRLLGTENMAEQLKLITDGTVEILGADFARIWMIEKADLCEQGCPHAAVTEGPDACRDRTRCLHLKTSSGRYTRTDGSHRRVPFGCYKVGRVASGQDTRFVTNDVPHDPRVHDPEWAKSLGLVAFAGYRLESADGQPTGVLALFRQRAILPHEEELLEDLAHTASQVVLAGAAAEALRQSESTLRSFCNSSPLLMGIVETDGDDIIHVYDNPATERFFGVPTGSTAGRRADELGAPRSAIDTWLASYRRCREQGRAVHFDYEHPLPGGPRWLSVTVAFISSVSGRPRFSYVAEDVTERKQMEAALRRSEAQLRVLNEELEQRVAERTAEAEARAHDLALSERKLRQQTRILQSVLNSMGDGVIVRDEQLRLILSNPAFERITGVPALEAQPEAWQAYYGWFLPDGVTPLPMEQQPMVRAVRGEAVDGFEAVVRNAAKPQGAYISVTSRPLRDESGVIRGGVSVFRDISDLKRAEENLRQQTRILQSVLNSMGDGVMVMDSQMQIVLYNPACERIAGVRPAEAPPEEWNARFGTFLPDGVTPFPVEQQPMVRAIRGEAVDDVEMVMRNAGQPSGVLISITGRPLRNERGDLRGGVVVFRDITEKKRAEQLLRESEARLRTIVENLNEGVVVATLDGRVTQWNRAALEMHGFTRLEEGQRGLHDFTDTFELSALDGTVWPVEQWPLSRIYRGEHLRDLEVNIRRLKGDWQRVFSYGGSLVRDAQGQPLLAVVTISDITERKRAELMLRESEARYRNLVESALDIIFTVSPDGRLLSLNQAFERITGWPCVEWVGKPYADLLHPNDLPRAVEESARLLKGVPGPPMVELRVKAKSGAYLTMEFIGTLYEEGGKIVGLLVTARDATERKRSEELLRESEARYRNLVESALDVIFTLGADGTVQSVNQAFETITGWPCRQWIGQPFAPLFHHHDVARVTQEVETTLRDKDNPRHIVEARVRTKSGSYLTMEFSGAPYEQGGRVVGILGIARDITEHKRLEQALLDVSEREQRRIGQDLHDGLCQHLAGVSFMTKVLAQKLAAERQADADEAKKIAELVRQAAGAARTIAAGLHPVKMEAHGAMDALQELARLTGDMFKVECRFHCDPPVLIADNRKAVHLYRIAQEAIHNAVTHGKATHIQMTLTAIRRRGGKITFTVKDDGVGLPDPLPPTRGMGLDIMRHRAQAIGGALDIRRGTEGGTVLTCSFVPSPPTNPEDNHGQQQQSHSS